MELKDLAGHVPALATAFGVTAAQVNLMLEFLGKKKIAKPDVEFKASIANMAKPGKKSFLFVEEEKGSFLFYNCEFPMQKKDIEPKLKKAEKALKTAKDGEKTSLEAQVTALSLFLDRIKKKKWLATSGKIAFDRVNAETSECFMKLAGKVEGPRKSSLHTVLAEVDFKDKNGNILRISTKDTSEEDSNDPTETVQEDDKAAQKRGLLRNKKVETIQGNLPKLQQAVGVADAEKVQANIDKYQQLLEEVIAEANADGVVTKEEQQNINKVRRELKKMTQHLERLGGRKIKLTPKNKAKVVDRMEKSKARLREMADRLGIQL
ncbi:MAG: hypothetical protein AB8E82_08115 [Aureispira sp.]